MTEAENDRICAHADITEIGPIGNYYGGLSVTKFEGRFYWSIENYDGNNWSEIPESLYEDLVLFEESRKAGA